MIKGAEMTSEQVMEAFKEKGIEVTIYQSPFKTIEKVVVDTYNHDKQIRAEVIDEFVEHITLPLTEEDIDRIARELKDQK